MEVFLVRGGAPLRGETVIQGAKNSVLPILAATVLSDGACEIHNCPQLSDVEAACEILRHLGAKVERERDIIAVSAQNLCPAQIPDALMQAMRSSVLFLGPLLARCAEAQISLPGGCELGPRPVDLHLEALRALGAEAEIEGACIRCRGTLHGGVIRLRYPSVGATENAMMAAAAATGVTVISGAACEPEICDLAGFLRALGAKISGDGTPAVVIEGGALLRGAQYRVMPDRIVTATWLSAAAAAGGEITLHGARASHIAPVIEVFSRAGARFDLTADRIRMCSERLRAPAEIVTAPYPGFPTDAQAPVMAGLLRAEGTTLFRETVFSARYAHVPELVRMGARITASGECAAVTGVRMLHAAKMEAKDLRGGAAVTIGALGAEGESRIAGLSHIDRGYEDMARDLGSLGARIERLEIRE